jgi:ankyrin repeat protein
MNYSAPCRCCASKAAANSLLTLIKLLNRGRSKFLKICVSQKPILFQLHFQLKSIKMAICVFRAVVLALLEAGFPVSALTPGGTALHEAALGGKLEVVRSLLDHGVSLSGRDQGNMTVLEVLAQFPAHLTHEMSALITRHSESWMLSKYQKRDRV